SAGLGTRCLTPRDAGSGCIAVLQRGLLARLVVTLVVGSRDGTHDDRRGKRASNALSHCGSRQATRPTGRVVTRNRRRDPKKRTKPSATRAPEEAALDDEAVAQRHRRYVGAFKFEHPQHPQLFEEYMSVYHVDFMWRENEFLNAEQAKRWARL